MALGIINGGTNTGTSIGVKYDPVAKMLMQSDVSLQDALDNVNQTLTGLSKDIEDLQALHNRDLSNQATETDINNIFN